MKSPIILMAICLIQINLYAQNLINTENDTNLNSGQNFLSNGKNPANVSRFNILKGEDISQENYKGKFDYENPNYFSYFFTSTGFGLPEKSIYYHNQYIISNTLGFGIHKNFSLTGGFIFFPNPFSGDTEIIFLLKPHVHVDISKTLHLAGGSLISHYSTNDISDNYSITLFFPYIVLTAGNSDANISFQLTGISDNYDYEKRSLQLMNSISGMYRLSKHFVLVGENMFFMPSKEVEYLNYNGIYGGHIIGKKGSFEFGLLIMYDGDPYAMDKTSYGPYLGYSRKF